MNVSLAGFDWISLLLIVIAGIIGLVKSSNAQKKRQQPIFPKPYREEDDIETNDEGNYATPEFTGNTETISTPMPEPLFSTDYYRKREPEKKNTLIVDDDDDDEVPQLDIRQAIISSEILKRPEF